MDSKLYIIEGLPCSGKSTTSAFVAKVLSQKHKVCYVDEGSGNHPADYEFHSFLNDSDFSKFNTKEKAKILSVSEENNGYIVPLSAFKGELFDKLLQYKIYDFLPWEKEKPVMLDKWRSFVNGTDKETVYVFNCVLLQNPMYETMMRFGIPYQESFEYIAKITEIIKPLKPIVIYLKNDDIGCSVEKASKKRDGWLDWVIDYHVNGAYGKSINAQGFNGYIKCLKERQKRELDILSQLDIKSVIIDNPHHNWDKAYDRIREIIE